MFARLLTLLVAANVCATHAASLQWEWLTPVPHRQSWHSMAAGNGHVVGLTDGLGGRSIYTWVNCSNWVGVASPTNVILKKVVFADGQFLAVGDSSTVVTSKDGIDWKLRHTDSAGMPYRQVAVGSGTYVALSGGPVLAYSKDLANWKSVMPDTGFTFTALAFGNGKFVAVGQGGKMFTSIDGAVWKNVPWPAGAVAASWSVLETGLVFRNGMFLMACDGGTATSIDGERWTTTGQQWLNNVFSTADGFLGINSQMVFASATGSNWSPILDAELPPGISVKCAVTIDGRTVVGGDNGLLYTTSDLVNWRRWVKDVDYTDSQILFGNGLYMRYGGTNGVCISSNGMDWQRIESAPGLKAACFANNFWVGFDHAGNVVVSENAKTWQAFSLPAIAKGRMLFADGRFMGDAEGGFLTSVDGRSWQFVAVPMTEGATIIGRANGIWSARVDGRAATSVDGLGWTVYPNQIGAGVFAAGSGRFVAISGGDMGMGIVTASTDGAHWEFIARNPSTHVPQSLSFVGGQFILTDRSGGIYESADGVNWTGGKQASQMFTSVAYGNGEFLVCGGDAILRSSTRVQSASALKLQLVQQSFNSWTLSINGNAGQTLEIESSIDLQGGWSHYQTITIPQTGVAQIPTDLNSANRFFRAKAIGL